MGTQKSRPNITVLSSTQNTCLNLWVRKLLKFYANKISLSGSKSVHPYIENTRSVSFDIKFTRQGFEKAC